MDRICGWGRYHDCRSDHCHLANCSGKRVSGSTWQKVCALYRIVIRLLYHILSLSLCQAMKRESSMLIAYMYVHCLYIFVFILQYHKVQYKSRLEQIVQGNILYKQTTSRLMIELWTKGNGVSWNHENIVFAFLIE